MAVQQAPLPLPDAEALTHSRQLIGLIRAAIVRRGGRIPFRDFMQLALYAPGLGYYVAGSRKLGAGGDFVTAPEISPLFSACLAQTIAPALRGLPQANILEIGAGSGIMAAGILRYLSAAGQAPAHYYILELSGDLRERQARTIRRHAPECLATVVWLDALPAGLSAVVLGNEVLDAMPVNIVTKQNAAWHEQYVAWQEDRLVWQAGEISDTRLAERMLAIEEKFGAPFAEGYTTEINLLAEDWLAGLGRTLRQGLVLLFDYGFPRHEFYHPQRSSGTLMCHYRHHAHADPFFHPGLQDITAHVDFTAMAEAAWNSGFRIEGYTNQGNFLIGSGLTELCQQQSVEELQPQMVLANQIKKLTLPHEMGELFKVLGLSKQLEVSLPGFVLRDLRNSL